MAMVDEATSGASAPLPRCMWCSAQLPSDSEVTCPSCGATLIGEGGESLVPGVTAIDFAGDRAQHDGRQDEVAQPSDVLDQRRV